MPANFRKSGKRYKSRNGLVKYQHGVENSHQLLHRRFDPNDGYAGNNTRFNPPLTRDSILRAREDSLTGINYHKRLEQLQNMMYGKDMWSWLRNRLQNPRFGVRMGPTQTDTLPGKTYYGGGEPLKISKKRGSFDTGVAFRKGGSCRFGCGTGPNGIL